MDLNHVFHIVRETEHLFYLTKFFRHRYCLRITNVFTINIQGTHARAMITKSDCTPICKNKKKKGFPFCSLYEGSRTFGGGCDELTCPL